MGIVEFAEQIGFPLSEAQKELAIELSDASIIRTKPIQLDSDGKILDVLALYAIFEMVASPMICVAVLCDCVKSRNAFLEKLNSVMKLSDMELNVDLKFEKQLENLSRICVFTQEQSVRLRGRNIGRLILVGADAFTIQAREEVVPGLMCVVSSNVNGKVVSTISSSETDES